MADERRYRSDAFEAIHRAAADLHAVGAISDDEMREFDANCLASPSAEVGRGPNPIPVPPRPPRPGR